MNSHIQANLTKIRTTLPQKVTLIAVSKFHPAGMIQEAYDAGQRIFGESKVQELLAKEAILPKDIQWHFIGHLQTNKVKLIVPFITLIHSVDSLRLIQEINKCAARENRIIDILLQIHIAQEQTKFGFSPQECQTLLQQHPYSEWKNIRIRGLMGMATFTDNVSLIRREFTTLRKLYFDLKETVFVNDSSFDELSFGMSDDYQIAVEEGSTMVRIGSNIFGTRNY